MPGTAPGIQRHRPSLHHGDTVYRGKNNRPYSAPPAKLELSMDQRVQQRFLKDVISNLIHQGQAGVSQVGKGSTGRRNNISKDSVTNFWKCIFRGLQTLVPAYLQIQPSLIPWQTKSHLPLRLSTLFYYHASFLLSSPSFPEHLEQSHPPYLHHCHALLGSVNIHVNNPSGNFNKFPYDPVFLTSTLLYASPSTARTVPHWKC